MPVRGPEHTSEAFGAIIQAMNRALLVATILLVLPLSQLPPAALAQQPPASPVPTPAGSPTPVGSPTPPPSPTPTPNLEDVGPESLQQRIDIFQDRRLIYELDEKTKAYSLRQGPDPIYDVDFIELMHDASLSQYWYGERNRDWGIWIGLGAVGVPVGSALFFQNFHAQGPLAIFASTETTTSAYANVSDPRSFALSLAGVALAMYGLYNLGLWLTEQLDTYHPNRLDEPAILPRVRQFNEDLRERLNLEPSQIPSPPTPRPSPTTTPSTSPSPGGFPLPNTPGRANDTNPDGEAPFTIPTPLPVMEPGVIPSALVPTPKPRPSEFLFPGAPGRVAGSPAVLPSPAGSPAVKASPKASPKAASPKPSAAPSVAYPGTEP
ncbi:MAG: hypothetical protein JWM80_4416 [Cyanobacteria bacterium RYN_339]|nr:hypothetical protein [Cyanobacteria bacterium RYN_339]